MNSLCQYWQQQSHFADRKVPVTLSSQLSYLLGCVLICFCWPLVYSYFVMLEFLFISSFFIGQTDNLSAVVFSFTFYFDCIFLCKSFSKVFQNFQSCSESCVEKRFFENANSLIIKAIRAIPNVSFHFILWTFQKWPKFSLLSTTIILYERKSLHMFLFFLVRSCWHQQVVHVHALLAY